jgi:hypothetical protein
VAFIGCGRQEPPDRPLPPAEPVASATTGTQATTKTDPNDPSSAPPFSTTTTQQSAPKPKTKPTPSADILSGADRSSFARLQARLGGKIGLAVSGLGEGQKLQRLGAINSVIAWSTSKVPIAMAIYHAGLASAQKANLRAAITASDNAAAERLWAALGGGTQAADAADAQLRAAGDDDTQIQPNRLRAGYTEFGQTLWKLTDQTQFTAGMACLSPGAQVLGLMNQTVVSQRWGLGAAGVPAQLKGGWGPGSQPGIGGGYLDRQMGVLTIHGTPLAVAIASQSADGSHQAGTAALTALARWLVAHADVRQLPTRPRCAL